MVGVPETVLLARIPPVVAALLPDEGLLVDRSNNPLREFAFDLAEEEEVGGGGLVSLLRFFPNFFFVVISEEDCCCNCGEVLATELIL